MPLDPNELETPASPITMPICDALRIRFGDLAKELEAAKTQGYVEANFAIKLLDLVKDVLAMTPFVG